MQPQKSHYKDASAWLTNVVKFDNINHPASSALAGGRPIIPNTRPIAWVKAALKDFRAFPEKAQAVFWTALTIAAAGGKSDIAKPWHGAEPGGFELALPFKGDAYRVIYAVQLADAVWVVHAFKKKSHKGIKTPKQEIDLVKGRIKLLKEMRG